MSSSPADEGHVVVSGKAVDGLVERLLPGPVGKEEKILLNIKHINLE